MSPLATVILAACAVYGYVCAYYTLLATRRRADREYLAFGLLAGAYGLHAVGDLLQARAETVEQAVRAHRVGSVALLVGSAFLVDFVAEVLGRPTRMRLVIYLWAASGLVALAAGLVWEPGEPPFGPYLSLLPEVPSPPVRATWLGNLYLALGLGVPFVIVGQLLSARDDPRAVATSEPGAMRSAYRRVIFATLSVSLLAAMHDALLWAGFIRSFRLHTFTAILFVGGISYMLLDRFVRASHALSERTHQLRQAYDDLRATQHRLVRKQQLAAVGELSAVIAHEVRNPLAVIKNAVSGLRRTTLAPGDRQTLLSILDEETTRLNRLMHDLLAYARPVLPRASELDVAELLRRSVDRGVGAIAEEPKSIRVEYDLRGPAKVFGDPELLRHALVNVIENAVQAMPSGGTLTVGSRDAQLDSGDAGVALVFHDTGEGMDTLVRAKARDPFFTTRPSGTGLGLAIVERVVRNHGGSVTIESSHGRGTTVTLSLPAERTSIVPIPPPEGGSGRLSGITEVRS